MQISSIERNRYFYEYVIYKLIDNHNKEAIENNNKQDLIRTTQARALERGLEDGLKQRNLNLGQLKPRDFQQTVVNMYSKALGKDVNFNYSFFQKRVDEFKKMTGLNQQATQMIGRNHYLPISPYDPRFAENDVVLANGSRLGGIPVSTNIPVEQLDNPARAQLVGYYSNLHNDQGIWSGKFKYGQTLADVNDVTGFARLRPLMKADDYAKASAHVRSSLNLTGATPEEIAEVHKQYSAMANKAAYLLKGLSSEGYSYTVSPDRMPGQIKARVDGTKLDIRLFDNLGDYDPDNKTLTQLKNARYIGRTYNNGVMGYYSTTRYGATASYVPTPQQSLDLINYALGRSVPIRDAKGQPLNMPIGTDRVRTRTKRGENYNYHAVFHNANGFSALAGPYIDPDTGKPDQYGNIVKMRFDTKHVHTGKMLQTPEDATAYIKNAIESAKTGMSMAIDANNLITQAKQHADDPDYRPELNPDEEIGQAQEAIWEMMTEKPADGQTKRLLRPGVSLKDLQEAAEKVNAGELDPSELDKLQYPASMKPEEAAKAYATDYINKEIGQYYPDQDGKTFDFDNVTKYQIGASGQFRNADQLVSAMRLAGLDGSNLKGTEEQLQQIRPRLAKFDQTSAVPMQNLQSPFMRTMWKAVGQALVTSGIVYDKQRGIQPKIEIDKNGIIHWQGHVAMAEEMQHKVNGKIVDSVGPIQGTIGPIFEPKQDGIDKGVIYENFKGGKNVALIPGYEAKILPQLPGEAKSMEERTILQGYQQKMISKIQSQIHQDMVLAGKKGITEVGKPDSLASVYHHLYGTEKPLDFVKQYQEQGMPQQNLAAMVQSMEQKVKYGKDIRQGSTVNAAFEAGEHGYDYANDNSLDPYNLTGNRNMAILTEESDGYFDPIASNATTTNQGTAKFLASGAKVDPQTGHITPGPKTGPGSRTSLMNLPEAKYMQYDPFDRQNMTISNWLQASSITPDVNVAQMTFGGWNQDDGVVASKDFAKNYQVRGGDGKMRPLKVGDKISDFNGNKGVINLIVDPDMDPKKAAQEHLTKEVKWFKNNPKMDIVMAPFPAVSRYNGGTARQLMRQPEDLVDLDGHVIKGAMGKMPMIITDKAADIKTRIYSQEDIKKGKGRKVSAQLAWAMASKGATNLMHEAFAQNGNQLNNFAEYSRAIGLNVMPDGKMAMLSDNDLANRHTIKQPKALINSRGYLNSKDALEQFSQEIGQKGGALDLPFKIEMPTGKSTNRIPVLSARLRCGQELLDKEVLPHDYTNAYNQIEKAVLQQNYAENVVKNHDKYVKERESLQNINNPTDADTDRLKVLSTLVRRYNTEKKHLDNHDFQKQAQESYNTIANDIKTRVFSGKHNFVKDKLMSHHMEHSATSIWTADPRLSIDEIKMGPKMAKSLQLKNGDSTLIWRDPVLRDGGLRYMKVSIDPRLTGVSINPSMDKSFDGDFDGDTVGIVSINGKGKTAALARQEAKEKFSPVANLLDYGSPRDKNGDYPLYMQHSLDIMVAEHNNPQLKSQWQDLTHKVNIVERDWNDCKRMHDHGKMNDEYYQKAKTMTDIRRTEAVNAINKYYQQCYQKVGDAHIKYTSLGDHLASVKAACLDTGAKGNPSKFADYIKWIGAKVPIQKDANGKMLMDQQGCPAYDFNHTIDTHKTGATREMQQKTELATATKTFGTGLAGAFSQRGIRALRNQNPKAVLELTYPVTQSVLQIKHDPSKAHKVYGLLRGPVRDLWRGHLMQAYKNPKTGELDFQTAKDQKGKPVQATKQQWINNFKQIYGDSGLGVDPNDVCVQMVADDLENKKTGRMINVENYPKQSTMDKLAYGGTFETALEVAKNNDNLFAGKYNKGFEPDSLRYNQREAAKEEQREKDLQAGKAVTFDGKTMDSFTKADVQPGYAKQQHYQEQVVQEAVQQDDDEADEAVDAKHMLQQQANEDKPVKTTLKTIDTASVDPTLDQNNREAGDNGMSLG